MSAARAKILSVDDHAPARYARRRLLQNAGFEVLDAANGREALAALSECPDLVILDVGLPDIDGYEVCRRIKADPKTAMITVLQVSASFVKGADRSRALEGGADNFLVEPVEPEVLIATVNAMMRVRKAEDALRRSAREWQATFDAISEGVALLDADARVLRCNSAFCNFVDRSPEQLANANWPGVLAEIAPREQRPSASGTRLRPFFRTRGRFIEVGTSPLLDSQGRVSGSVVVLTDVSDHRRALAAAEEANRLKDDFLAILSHELRTPLNAIVGWSQLLQSGRLDADTTKRAVQTIHRNSLMQNQLISDILDVSRIVAGKLRLELVPVDLVAVIEAVQDTLSPQAFAKDVKLEIALAQPAGVVMGDQGRLQQIVWNLGSNAIKFSRKGSTVTVRLLGGSESADIVVEDDGPGIAPEFLPYVFDRFRQADSSSTRPKGGLGLGLAIVRHLVEMHGGSVEAANRPEGGAVFTVHLPVQSASAGRSVPAAVVPDASASLYDVDDGQVLAGLRVLVVDDEEDARDLLRTVLVEAGADVITAASAAEALPLVERERPDVLVSDVEMPGEDGYALLRRLRALDPERGGDTPAVALTAYASTEDMLRALRAGFQIHIAKPVSPHELVAVAASLGRPHRVAR